MMCYYLNVQFQGQRVNAVWGKSKCCLRQLYETNTLCELNTVAVHTVRTGISAVTGIFAEQAAFFPWSRGLYLKTAHTHTHTHTHRGNMDTLRTTSEIVCDFRRFNYCCHKPDVMGHADTVHTTSQSGSDSMTVHKSLHISTQHCTDDRRYSSHTRCVPKDMKYIFLPLSYWSQPVLTCLMRWGGPLSS